VGPQYRRTTLASGNIYFRAAAQISFKNYQRHELEFGLPRLASNHASLDFLATRRSYPSLNYYGPGPDSKKTGRTDFLYEDVTFDGKAVLKPFKNLNVGASGGYMLINVGPGRSDDFASTDQTYPPSAAPGINRQTNYLRAGPLVSFDYRDHPGNPHKGGYYWGDYLYYSDRGLGGFGFRRLDAEVQQYIPFFNSTHVIAIRGKTQLSYTDAGQTVPFYMQPVLGGLDDLRGFRPFRFYDDNMIVLNGEYRHQIFTGTDMVIFADQGKVFHAHRDFNLHDLESSYGFGFRFSSEEATFMRVETGFSREGFQVFVKFGSIW
jgi:outer membrane protein assembly factor BamA